MKTKNAKKRIVTIGGGIAGIEASYILSSLGHEVSLLEKKSDIGGNLFKWHYLFPNLNPASDLKNVFRQKANTGNFYIYRNTYVYSIVKNDDTWYIETNQKHKLRADAVIVATGFDFFDAARKEEYGYKIYENVITSVDLEEKFSQENELFTPSGKKPGRIAFIHCVGSRDEKTGNHHCSKVCCITGVKQAIELNKALPDAEVYCFYMDLRMYGQYYEELYREAQEKYNIQFIRGRLSEASENMDKSLLIKAEDTLSGRPLKMTVDLLVLLIGMEAGEGTRETGEKCHLSFTSDGFLKSLNPHDSGNISSQPGIFLAGSCSCPMSVKDTLENARSAALEVHRYVMKG